MLKTTTLLEVRLLHRYALRKQLKNFQLTKILEKIEEEVIYAESVLLFFLKKKVMTSI